MIPWILTFCLFIARSLTNQMLIFLYACFLTFWNLALFILKTHYQLYHPAPVGCDVYYWGFPSFDAFFVGSIVGFFITYWLLFYGKVTFGKLNWLWISFLFFIPPFVLIWFGPNPWYIIIASLFFGIFVTAPFVAILRLLSRPYSDTLDLLNKMYPFCWLSLCNTWLDE